MVFPRISGKVRTALFDNGLRVYVIPKNEAPTVTVQAWVATGSIHEDEFLGCGLSHFLEHMLFQGTKKFPGNAVSDTVTHLGGYLNAYTSKTHTVYYINLPAAHVAKGIEMVDDMVRNPLFPAEKFLSEKNVILRECAMYQDSPDSVLYERLVAEAYQLHPMRHPVIGYKEKIESVTREIMCAYHAKRYTPGRTFYVIAGDVDPDRITDLLNQRTCDWNMGSLAEPFLPQEPSVTAKRERIIHFNDPMTRVACAWQLPSSLHPDIPAIEVFSDIFGGSASSRLTTILKNEKELALDISSYLYSLNVSGLSGFGAACLEENRQKLTDETFRILGELTKNGPTKQEMERTIAQQTADCLRAMRTESGLAQIVGNAVLNGGGLEAADEYLSAMQNVTRDDLVRIGEQYFHPQKATLVHMLPLDSKARGRKTKAAAVTAEHPVMQKMKGGQKMIYLHDAALPLVDLFLMLPGGAYYEGKAIRGTTKLIAAALAAGCRKYTEKELNEILDSHAIDFTVSAGTASIRIAVNCPKDQLPLACGLLCDILSAPLFPEKAVERERTAILEELKVKLNTPDGLAENLLMSSLFAKHPYGNTLEESIGDISKVKADSLRTVYEKLCLNAGKAIFGVSGDLTEKEAENVVSKIIASCKWSRAGLKEPASPAFPQKAVRKVRKLEKAQAVMFLGMPGPCADSDDVPALDILRTASSSMSSHLFQNVRNRNGLAYYTGCINMPGINTGCIAYYAGTSAESAKKLEALFHEEIRRVTTQGLSEQEFSDAKAAILYRLDSSMQSPDKRLVAAVTGEFTGKGYLEAVRKRETLEKLTLKEVNRIIRKYLSVPGKVTVLVTPEKQ